MSFQTIVLQAIAQINARLNAITVNAKKNSEFPAQTSLVATSKIHVDNSNVSQYVTIQQIIDAAILAFQTANLNSQKITLTSTFDFQTVFLLPTPADNIDINYNDGFLTEGYGYTYNATTGEITLTVGVPEGGEINVRTYTNELSTKQIVIASTDGQTVFNYTGSPSNIEVMVNDGFLTEGYGYTKTNFSSGNYITLTSGVPSGSSVQIRKF